MEGEQDILARFDRAVAVAKDWSGLGDWRGQPFAGGITRWERVIGLRVSGIALAGLQARLVCRSDIPERDVYAQLEMHIPEVSRFGHFQRVSWRPLKLHTNSAKAPASLKMRSFSDRCEPFHLNRQLGIAGLQQLVPTVAEALPDGLETFRDLTKFLQGFWRIASLDKISDPPWEKRLL